MAKKKNTLKLKWYWIIPVILVIVICIFVYSLFFTSSNDAPVYGRRCQVSEIISDSKIKNAKTAVSQVGGVASSDVEVNCLTVDVTLTIADGVTIADAEAIATSVTHVIDDSFGYEKYADSDLYSKIFSNNGTDRMYDFEITIYGAGGSYTIFGTKNYQNDEVSYTSSEAKDQSLVDSLHSSQSSDATTTDGTTTDGTTTDTTTTN